MARLALVFGVRRVAHAGVELGTVVQHAAGVGESFEAEPAVILAHAGIADTTERQFRNERMDGAVVDDGVAGFCSVEDLFDDVVVLGEDVQAERCGVTVHPVDHGRH